VVGATNSKAEYPAERPYSPQDLLATIYRHLESIRTTPSPTWSARFRFSGPGNRFES
jgi:hypothetical protein